MATLRATFMTIEARAPTGATLPVCDLSGGVRLADLTTSGSSLILQAIGGGDFVAPSAGVVLLSADGAVNVAAAAAPVASSSTGAYLFASTPYTFTVKRSDKIAAINA